MAMDLVFGVILGVLVGVVGSLPGGLLARRARKGQRVSVGGGLFATLTSFLWLTVALGMGYMVQGARSMAFAIALVAAFLAAWGREAWYAWQWMRPWS